MEHHATDDNHLRRLERTGTRARFLRTRARMRRHGHATPRTSIRHSFLSRCLAPAPLRRLRTNQRSNESATWRSPFRAEKRPLTRTKTRRALNQEALTRPTRLADGLGVKVPFQSDSPQQ